MHKQTQKALHDKQTSRRGQVLAIHPSILISPTLKQHAVLGELRLCELRHGTSHSVASARQAQHSTFDVHNADTLNYRLDQPVEAPQRQCANSPIQAANALKSGHDQLHQSPFNPPGDPL